MKLLPALIESAKKQEAERFRKIIEKLHVNGVPVIDLPLMVLNVNQVGVKAHKWAWNQIENWQTAD